MDSERRPTLASEIAPPVRREFVLVELNSLRTKDGARVRVRCDRPDPVAVLDLLALPGAYPRASDAAPATGRTRDVMRALEAAPALVHRWTAFAGEDGAEVRPAFHCDDAHAVPGSVAWGDLMVGDQVLVMSAFMNLSGFGGAADAEFPAGG